MFLGYCTHCSVEYNYERGIGLDENGKETRGNDIVFHVYKYGYDYVHEPFSEEEIKRNSIYNTYLKDTTHEELLQKFPTVLDIGTDARDEPFPEHLHEHFPEHLPEHLPQCCQEFFQDKQSSVNLMNVVDDEEDDGYKPTPENIQSWFQDPATFNWEFNDWENDIEPEKIEITLNQNTKESILAMAKGLLECKAIGLFKPTAQKRESEPEFEVLDEESHSFDAIEGVIQQEHIGLR